MTPEEATNRITMFMTTAWSGLDVDPELEALKIIQAQRKAAVAEYQASLEAHKSSLWQPIETAPKDRTMVDLWSEPAWSLYKSYHYARFCNAWWSNEEQEWVYDPQDRCNLHKITAEITHWMPLPLPPKQKEDI